MFHNYNKRFRFSLNEKIMLNVLNIICSIVGRIFRITASPPPTAVKKILVIKTGGFGDVILVTPALKALKRKYPSAHISVLIPEITKDVLKNNPCIDTIIPVKFSWWRNKKDILKMIKFAWKLRKEEYDLGFDFRGDVQNILMLFLSGTKYKVGFGDISGGGALLNKSIPYVKQHEIDSSLYVLKSIGIDAEDKEMFLKTDNEDLLYINNYLQKKNVGENDTLIGFHPSTPWKPRDWPIEKYAALGDYLTEKWGARIILLGKGEKDNTTAAEIYTRMSHKPIIGTDIIDIRKVVVLIQRLDVFICNDSSPAHFAALTNTPTIVLFGPDDPILWKYPQHICVRKDISCHPCRQRICPQEGQKWQCMNLIEVDDVIHHIKNILKR
jgi:ADP-heptose:LPS heptosyltransferase